MNDVTLTRIASSLEGIEKSLSTLAEDTKARKELEYVVERKKDRYSTWDFLKDSALTFTLGIVVGCMLFQLGIELLK